MEYKNTWSTSDFYSAVIIKTCGVPLSNLSRENNKFVIFHFNASPQECEILLQKYWNRELRLEVRKFIENVNEMKTRIYEKLREV